MSLPQMPVSLVRRTAHSGPRSRRLGYVPQGHRRHGQVADEARRIVGRRGRPLVQRITLAATEHECPHVPPPRHGRCVIVGNVSERQACF